MNIRYPIYEGVYRILTLFVTRVILSSEWDVRRIIPSHNIRLSLYFFFGWLYFSLSAT